MSRTSNVQMLDVERFDEGNGHGCYDTHSGAKYIREWISYRQQGALPMYLVLSKNRQTSNRTEH